MWRKFEGINASTEADINYFGSSQNNRDNAQDYLKDKYGYDYSKEEASAYSKRANGIHTEGATVKSANSLAKMVKMKGADEARNQGRWVKEGGLHTGYGFGFKGSFKTTTTDELRSLRSDTLKVGREGLQNSMGFLSAQQKLAYESSGNIGKAMVLSNPLASAFMMGSGMINGEDPGQIMTEQLSQAAGFTGFVAGARVGGAVSNMISNRPPSTIAGYLGKGGARLLGGGVLGVGAYAAVQGISAGIRDVSSAESNVGSTFYKMASRDYYGDVSQNRSTLTARQKALQQVNSSVFNDRGFTLGNEASILANVSL